MTFSGLHGVISEKMVSTHNNQRYENLKSYLGTKIDVAEDVSSIMLPAKGMKYSERCFSIIRHSILHLSRFDL
jgi:hypothetical protein